MFNISVPPFLLTLKSCSGGYILSYDPPPAPHLYIDVCRCTSSLRSSLQMLDTGVQVQMYPNVFPIKTFFIAVSRDSFRGRSDRTKSLFHIQAQFHSCSRSKLRKTISINMAWKWRSRRKVWVSVAYLRYVFLLWLLHIRLYTLL